MFQVTYALYFIVPIWEPLQYANDGLINKQYLANISKIGTQRHFAIKTNTAVTITNSKHISFLIWVFEKKAACTYSIMVQLLTKPPFYHMFVKHQHFYNYITVNIMTFDQSTLESMYFNVIN